MEFLLISLRPPVGVGRIPDGLNDRGKLEAGKRADLILFSFEGNELVVKRTFVKGELVFDSTK